MSESIDHLDFETPITSRYCDKALADPLACAACYFARQCVVEVSA
jgi:hypothetical protein